MQQFESREEASQLTIADKSAVAASADKKTQTAETLHLAKRQSAQVGVLKTLETAATATTMTTESTAITPQQHEKLEQTLRIQVD